MHIAGSLCPKPVSNADDQREAARDLDRWRTRHRFYHQHMAEYLRFVLPEGESVLLLGCEDGALLSALSPSFGVGVDCRPEMIARARRRNPQHQYVVTDDYAIDLERKFDYVVLNDVTGEVHDLFKLLRGIARLCTPGARVVERALAPLATPVALRCLVVMEKVLER